MFNIGKPPEPTPEPERDPRIASGLDQPNKPDQPPDIQTQYEDLIHQVFDSERRERMLDRIDIAVALEERKKARRRKKPKR